MKTQARFEIRTLIKGRIILNISGSQTYHEMCQIHRTSAVLKMLVFMRLKIFQDRLLTAKMVPVLVSQTLLLSVLILLL